MTAQVLEATPTLTNGVVSWSLCNQVSGQCGGQGSFPSVTLPPASGATPFMITIKDTNHTGVIFAADPNAIWIQPTTDGCPQAYVWNSGGQIPSYDRVTDTKIQFTDSNAQNGSQSLTYRLNFTLNGQPVTSIDPIIQNGGCCAVGYGFGQQDYAIMAGALLVVLVLIYFGYRNFAAKRAGTGAGPGSTTGPDDISRNG